MKENNSGGTPQSHDIYSNSYEDISSSSSTYEDIYSGKREEPNTPPPPAPRRNQAAVNKKNKKKKKHRFIKFVIALILISVILAGAFYAYAYSVVDKITRVPLDGNDLGISTSQYADVKNIALLGIDSRVDGDSGRSDAIVIMSVDKKGNIKLTSLARDTYVAIAEHGSQKLTHAYAYGKSQLAVKTINQNFGLEIKDYVTMNFFQFSRIIDDIGGVEIDVAEEERVEINNHIMPELIDLGVSTSTIAAAGLQTLDGGQALCYARIRHTDNDIQRGNRQKLVLTAMFKKMKKLNPLRLPALAEKILSECETSMSTNDILMLGMRGMLHSSDFEQLSVPNENIPSSGKTIGGSWCYVYDLETARNDIYDFIHGLNYYSAQEKAKREAEAAAAAAE